MGTSCVLVASGGSFLQSPMTIKIFLLDLWCLGLERKQIQYTEIPGGLGPCRELRTRLHAFLDERLLNSPKEAARASLRNSGLEPLGHGTVSPPLPQGRSLCFQLSGLARGTVSVRLAPSVVTRGRPHADAHTFTPPSLWVLGNDLAAPPLTLHPGWPEACFNQRTGWERGCWVRPARPPGQCSGWVLAFQPSALDLGKVNQKPEPLPATRRKPLDSVSSGKKMQRGWRMQDVFRFLS